MKINERDALNITKPNTDRLIGPTKPGSGSASSAKNSQTGSDGIDLGSQSGLISQTLQAGSTERASFVEQLRTLVQSGQYQVDTAALSQAIVSGAVNGY